MAREKALLDADERKKNKASLEKEIIKDKRKNQRKLKKNRLPLTHHLMVNLKKPQRKRIFHPKKLIPQGQTSRKKETKGDDKDKSTKKPKSEPQKRRKGKLTISEALNENERQRSLASIRRRQEKAKKEGYFN